MKRWYSSFILLLSGISLQGCAAPHEMICPTTRVSCDCADLERREPLPEVQTLIQGLRDLDEPSLQAPIAAATDLELRCRDPRGWFLPPAANRDDDWRQQCSAAELALPALLHTLEAIEERRSPGRGNREQENVLVDRVVSASGNILLGNAESVCRSSVIDALIVVLDTPETAQGIRINLTALRLLGELGDDRAIPALVRALFIRSQERPLSLLEPARTALQKLDDHVAVARALVRAGSMEDEALNRMQDGTLDLDVRTIKEEVANTLGVLGVTNGVVVGYLMTELAHDSDDEVDRAPSRGRVNFTPARSRAFRRGAAARALGRLRHLPALEVILPRLALNEDGSSVDSTVDITEVPAFLDAIGDMLMPSRTNATLLTWLARGDEILRDRAARRLSLQGGAELADRLSEVAAGLPECSSTSRGCVRRDFEQVYIPALRASADCSDVSCWRERVSAEPTSPPVRIHAAYQLAMLAQGDQDASEQALTSLRSALQQATGETLDAIVFAIDRLSPRGCDDSYLGALQSYIDDHRGDPSDSHEVRAISSLQGRLRFRAHTTSP